MRNKTNANRGTGKGKSRYAQKLRSGKMMYGPGCGPGKKIRKDDS